jgi:CBS domain-containing protein
MRRDEPVTRIMTETVVVIEADRPISEALDCFGQYGIRHLPVVRDGRLAGMLSSADVLKLEHFAPKTGPDGRRFLDERFRIEQFMRTPVVHVRLDATIGDAAETLMASGVHALPVVDASDRVVGIVSSTDLIRSLLSGPPRRGDGPAISPADVTGNQRVYYFKPTDEEFATALGAAEAKHVDDRDPKFIAKSLLYLAQRRAVLEQVLTLADRFLRAGQDEQNHALLLKAILKAKRMEEHATGDVRVPFPLE